MTEERQLENKREQSTLPTQWRPYTSYSSSELQAMIFPNIEKLERAIELCWNYTPLKGVPRFSPDGSTLIVPKHSIEYFQDGGVTFTTEDVFGFSDLSSDEIAEMRALRYLN